LQSSVRQSRRALKNRTYPFAHIDTAKVLKVVDGEVIAGAAQVPERISLLIVPIFPVPAVLMEGFHAMEKLLLLALRIVVVEPPLAEDKVLHSYTSPEIISSVECRVYRWDETCSIVLQRGDH
jgi:hypothetical protein